MISFVLTLVLGFASDLCNNKAYWGIPITYSSITTNSTLYSIKSTVVPFDLPTQNTTNDNNDKL